MTTAEELRTETGDWRFQQSDVPSPVQPYPHTCGVKGKGKAIPLQAWTGPEGSRMLRLPDFKTIDT